MNDFTFADGGCDFFPRSVTIISYYVPLPSWKKAKDSLPLQQAEEASYKPAYKVAKLPWLL
jgi:hypothetical protein